MTLRDYKVASTLSNKKKSSGKLSFFIIGLLLGVIVSYGCLTFVPRTSISDFLSWPKQLSATLDSIGVFFKRMSEKENLPPMKFEFQRLERDSEINSDPSEKFKSGFLQAGSFRTYGDADSVKALLAISGIKSEIKRIVTTEGDIWFRVLVGPILSESAIREKRIAMIEQGIIPIFQKKTED